MLVCISLIGSHCGLARSVGPPLWSRTIPLACLTLSLLVESECFLILGVTGGEVVGSSKAICIGDGDMSPVALGELVCASAILRLGATLVQSRHYKHRVLISGWKLCGVPSH